jgi:hypothetical protein
MEEIDINLIPGMIEPVERELLYRLARELPFTDSDCAVEFGCFFGRSTAFIARGLREHSPRVPKLHVYDSFGCDSRGGFRASVLEFAEAGGVRELVREENGRVDFLPVFHFYHKKNIESGALVVERAELANSHPPGDSIMLMHIDSPKLYVDFKPILFRFFPKLKHGGCIVFQDFFYHWSATLIAAVGALVHFGVLDIRESAASSLVCRLQGKFDERVASEVDLALSSDDRILWFMDCAFDACVKIPLDRSDIFLPRLHLAKLQWLLERRQGEQAAQVVASFFRSGGKLNHAILNDFIELISGNFSIERLYRLDHRV